MKRKKISVVFLSKLDINEFALKYVILSLNKNQKLFEFYFPDVEGTPLNNKEYSSQSLFLYCNSVKENLSGNAEYFIFLLNSNIEGNYFSIAQNNISIISTNKWDKYFSPPSIFEYIIDSFISNLLVMDNNLSLGFHDDTYGCILDYKRLKTHIKPSILLGYLCDVDKELLVNKYGEAYFQEIENIISQKWLGSINTKADISYNLKHCFNININKDSGFNKTFLEKAKDKFVELPLNFIVIIVTALFTLITSYLLYHYLGVN